MVHGDVCDIKLHRVNPGNLVSEKVGPLPSLVWDLHSPLVQIGLISVPNLQQFPLMLQTIIRSPLLFETVLSYIIKIRQLKHFSKPK